MTKQFNKTALDVSKSIRKEMPPASKTIKSKKDKLREKDKKAGRKNWQKFDESITKENNK